MVVTRSSFPETYLASFVTIFLPTRLPLLRFKAICCARHMRSVFVRSHLAIRFVHTGAFKRRYFSQTAYLAGLWEWVFDCVVSSNLENCRTLTIICINWARLNLRTCWPESNRFVAPIAFVSRWLISMHRWLVHSLRSWVLILLTYFGIGILRGIKRTLVRLSRHDYAF